MILRTMWGKRAHAPADAAELMVAWDEFSEDGNAEGFAKECEEARASWGDDLAAWRMIDIRVTFEGIEAAFDLVEVLGEVAAAPKGATDGE